MDASWMRWEDSSLSGCMDATPEAVGRRYGMKILAFIAVFLLGMCAQVLLDKLGDRLRRDLGEGAAE